MVKLFWTSSSANILVKKMLPNISRLWLLLIGWILINLMIFVAGDIEPKPYNFATAGAVFLDDSIKFKSNLNELIPDEVNNPNKNSETADGIRTKLNPDLSNVGFLHGFATSLSVIIVSELADKTFFIAAIMAMRHPRITVFIGAISALALMTILSAVFGMAATIIPRVYTYYISTALFAIFGLKMLREGYYMSPTSGQEELEEVQSDLRKREDELNKQQQKQELDTDEPGPSIDLKSLTRQNLPDTNDLKTYDKETTSALILSNDLETGGCVGGNSNTVFERKKRDRFLRSITSTWKYLISRVFMQAFTMTFLAEWGDRSQLTTIILSARENVYGVIIGGILGHSICTGLAVIGGRIIAQKISVRTVTLVGGLVFLICALSALFFTPNGDEEQEAAQKAVGLNP